MQSTHTTVVGTSKHGRNHALAIGGCLPTKRSLLSADGRPERLYRKISWVVSRRRYLLFQINAWQRKNTKIDPIAWLGGLSRARLCRVHVLLRLRSRCGSLNSTPGDVQIVAVPLPKETIRRARSITRPRIIRDKSSGQLV